MRPTKLTMCAFGPYADKVEVDFEAMGTSGVYLVCGDTGAGKTMIFDAICFALFGEASGDSKGGARSTTSMRSDYATQSSKTYVELLFEYRGAMYRIKRNPEYERMKSRGEGTTKQKADAEIEFPDKRVVSGVRRVNAEIESLLGIDGEQFKQIVMLAQGEFRKLLTADTEMRETIFRKLFGTERYELLQGLLAEESRRLERENTEVKARIISIAQQARFPEGSAALDASRRGEDALRGDSLVKALEEMLSADVPKHEGLESEVEDLRTQWHESNALLKSAESRSALEADKAKLEAEIASLNEQAPKLEQAFAEQVSHDKERDQATERVARIEGLFPKYEDIERITIDLEKTRASSEAAKKTFESAKGTYEDAEARMIQLVSATNALEGADVRVAQAQAVRDGVAREVDGAKKLLDALADLQKRQQRVHDLSVELDNMRDSQTEALEKERAAREALQEAQRLRESLSGAVAELAKAQGELDKAKRALADALRLRDERERLAGAHEKAKHPYEETLERLKEAEVRHDAASRVLRGLQKRQREGRAGLLAGELEEGQPCPVCGSIHHPSPAAARGSVPTDAEIDEASDQEMESEKHASALSLEAERLKTVLVQASAALDEFDITHGGAELLERELVSSKEDADEAEKKLRAAADRKAGEDDAVKKLETAREAHDVAKSASTLVAQQLQGVREALISANAEMNALKEGLESESIENARSEYDDATNRLKRADADLTHARSDAAEFSTKRAELVEARSAAQEASRAYEKAKDDQQKLLTAETIVKNRLAGLKSDLEFASLDEAKAQAASSREKARTLADARDSAERAVSANRAALATKQELLNEKIRQLDRVPVADADATKAHMDEIRQRADRLKAEASAVKTRIDANESCLEGLKKALSEAHEIEKRYGRVKALADVATGNLVGQTKVRFEAYVQAIYFDKVIEAANLRLKTLTSGQFELIRYSDGSGNAKAGLGLYVIDSFTGRARDASSLSGGESFQASLCLALGLSDIVQAHAGGIEFDTMFVDEGFGSLDQGALGNAISLLADLSGGNKLVGIISHVEDLKANIPKKILVTKTRSGSSVSVER